MQRTFPLLSAFLNHILYSFHPMLGVIVSQYPNIVMSKLPAKDYWVNCLACGLWLPRAEYNSPRGKSVLHCHNMWYDREFLACHTRDVGRHWVRFRWELPLVGHIRYPKCTATLLSVGVEMIMIRINLLPVVWWFWQWIQKEPCGCQWACCTITLCGYRFSQRFMPYVFCIIARQIIRIRTRLTAF